MACPLLVPYLLFLIQIKTTYKKSPPLEIHSDYILLIIGFHINTPKKSKIIYLFLIKKQIGRT